MIYPDLSRFISLSRRGNLIPVYKEFIADFETPVSAFKKLGDTRYAFLLESVEGGEHLARYSFLGADPFMVLRARAGSIEVSKIGEAERRFYEGDPLRVLEMLLTRYRSVQVEGLPRFHGGAVGYIGYDVVRHYESLPSRTTDDLGLPDAVFMFSDTFVVFDHLKHRIQLISNAIIDGEDVRRCYESAVGKIEELEQRLKGPIPVQQVDNSDAGYRPEVRSNFTRSGFEDIVRKAKEYIFAGDVIQVVLSQRLDLEISQPPFDVYRALRSINPSPYMFYLKLDDLILAGSSPELLVRVEDGKIEYRPIAGTRPRGSDEGEDATLAAELLADAKERAEHIMLVDLGRNDVGRVAGYGTVEVPDLMVIEKYSHVMHMVSGVRARLRPDRNQFDALRVCFPAGTVTGAPKIRAMEIIDELEPTRRGPYAGTVGYFSFSGNLDSCITIRTIVIKGDTAYIQAGAGIVADSEPEKEYEETLNKAKALVGAITLAQRGL